MTEKIIPTEVVTRATAALQQEIEKELKVEDPDKDKAQAILNENS